MVPHWIFHPWARWLDGAGTAGTAPPSSPPPPVLGPGPGPKEVRDYEDRQKRRMVISSYSCPIFLQTVISRLILVTFDFDRIGPGPGVFSAKFAVSMVQAPSHRIRLALASNFPPWMLNTVEYGPQNGLVSLPGNSLSICALLTI